MILASRASKIAAAAAVLLAGMGLGAWGMRLYFDRTLAAWDPAERFVARLGQDLDLTPDQRERVRLIVEEQKARMESRRKGWRLEVRVLAREGEGQIARLLTPAQTERYQRLADSIHSRMDRLLWTSEDSTTAQAIGGPAR